MELYSAEGLRGLIWAKRADKPRSLRGVPTTTACVSSPKGVGWQSGFVLSYGRDKVRSRPIITFFVFIPRRGRSRRSASPVFVSLAFPSRGKVRKAGMRGSLAYVPVVGVARRNRGPPVLIFHPWLCFVGRG